MRLRDIKSILLTAAILVVGTTTVFPQSSDFVSSTDSDKFGSSASQIGSHDIAGSWRATVTPHGFDAFEALLTFGEGGGVIGSAQGDILLDPPPGTAPGATAVHGSWKKVAKRRYLFTVRQIFYGADGSYQGGNKVRNFVILNSNGDKITGHYQFDLYDANGIVIVSGTGAIQGARIETESLTP